MRHSNSVKVGLKEGRRVYKKKTSKMKDSNMSIIMLKMNVLNTAIKRHSLLENDIYVIYVCFSKLNVV